jgi:hypothetical protein
MRADRSFSFVQIAALTSALAFPLLAISGCQPAAQAPLSASTQSSAVGIDARNSHDNASDELVEETWDAYSMRDGASQQPVRIGHAHTTTHKVVESGQPLLRTKSVTHTAMQRSGQDISQDMTLTSWDTPAGQLVRFETRVSGAGSEIVSVGAVTDGKLGIDTTTLGRTQSQIIPWPDDAGGLFAGEQSLRRQPLKPGEKRTVRGFMPLMNVPVTTELSAINEENVELPSPTGIKHELLLKISATLNLGAQKIESILWTNDRGETLKTLIPSIGQESVRTTKEAALRQSDEKPYDLLFASTVPLKGVLNNPPGSKRVVYRARLKNGSIQGLFSEGPTQQVKPIDDRTAEITVTSIRPGQASPQQESAKSTAEPADLASNNFIQTDDPLIQQMATAATTDANDPWAAACALEKLVAQAVENKSYSQAFATAAEVARTGEGDCTEHAVLLAALCRAKQIPARCAFGLVYYPPEKGFAYHMWNEVLIGTTWVPVDATLGQGGIAADHIKLGDSNLAGGSPLADLLSVIQVFGRLELEVLDQK